MGHVYPRDQGAYACLERGGRLPSTAQGGSRMSIRRWLIQLFHKKIESSLQKALSSKVGGAPIRVGGALHVHSLHASLDTSAFPRPPESFQPFATTTPALKARMPMFLRSPGRSQERVTAHTHSKPPCRRGLPLFPRNILPCKKLPSSPHQPSLLLALWPPTPSPPTPNPLPGVPHLENVQALRRPNCSGLELV